MLDCCQRMWHRSQREPRGDGETARSHLLPRQIRIPAMKKLSGKKAARHCRGCTAAACFAGHPVLERHLLLRGVGAPELLAADLALPLKGHRPVVLSQSITTRRGLEVRLSGNVYLSFGCTYAYVFLYVYRMYTCKKTYIFVVVASLPLPPPHWGPKLRMSTVHAPALARSDNKTRQWCDETHHCRA
jgi:hypothetical protein